MKDLTRIWVCICCVLFANILYGQNGQIIDNQESIMKMEASEVFACKLQGPELMKRKAALEKEVFSKVKSIEEKSDGYLFLFEDKGDFLLTLVDYMLAEQKCCPFFQFDLMIKANHAGVGLKVSGPPQVKEMIKMMLNK